MSNRLGELLVREKRISLEQLRTAQETTRRDKVSLGYALARLTAAATQTEFFRMPFVIFPSTFGIAIIVVLIAAACSGLVIVRRILRLDLVSVLKSRE